MSDYLRLDITQNGRLPEMPFSFPYTFGSIDKSPAFPDGARVCRPLLKILLAHGEALSEPLDALVDTGADFCIFPATVADQLNLKWEELPSAPGYGAGTDHDIRFARITIIQRELGPWPVYAGLSKEWSARGIGILGWMGFLEHMNVSFKSGSQLIQLEPRGLKTSSTPEGL